MLKTKNKRGIGTYYEKRAGEYLMRQGYQILEYNFRCKFGEIDIIARDGRYLVFCEVKYRNQNMNGHPAEAVDVRKRRVISKCALYYLTVRNQLDHLCRFDVVAISGEQLVLYKNAFEYIG